MSRRIAKPIQLQIGQRRTTVKPYTSRTAHGGRPPGQPPLGLCQEARPRRAVWTWRAPNCPSVPSNAYACGRHHQCTRITTSVREWCAVPTAFRARAQQSSRAQDLCGPCAWGSSQLHPLTPPSRPSWASRVRITSARPPTSSLRHSFRPSGFLASRHVEPCAAARAIWSQFSWRQRRRILHNHLTQHRSSRRCSSSNIFRRRRRHHRRL